MRRLAHWLRIGLACSVLWASAAAVATPIARAEVQCWAHAAAPERAAAAESQRRIGEPPGTLGARPQRRTAAVRPAFPPRALARPLASRLYLRHCVLLR